jgi:hypothetical protein
MATRVADYSHPDYAAGARRHRPLCDADRNSCFGWDGIAARSRPGRHCHTGCAHCRGDHLQPLAPSVSAIIDRLSDQHLPGYRPRGIDPVIETFGGQSSGYLSYFTPVSRPEIGQHNPPKPRHSGRLWHGSASRPHQKHCFSGLIRGSSSFAVLPLRFASASPPSGYTGDFHLQTVGHVRHTAWPYGPPPAAAAGLTAPRPPQPVPPIDQWIIVRPARPLPAFSATFLSVRNYDFSIRERHDAAAPAPKRMIGSQSPPLEVLISAQTVSHGDVPPQRLPSIAAVQTNHILLAHGTSYRHSRGQDLLGLNGLSKAGRAPDARK